MAQTMKCRGVQTSTTHEPVTGTLSVIYRGTEVVKVKENLITLNSGGWYTATTKLRMNQASNEFNLHYKVYAKRGRWFVDYLGETAEWHRTFSKMVLGGLGKKFQLVA